MHLGIEWATESETACVCWWRLVARGVWRAYQLSRDLAEVRIARCAVSLRIAVKFEHKGATEIYRPSLMNLVRFESIYYQWRRLCLYRVGGPLENVGALTVLNSKSNQICATVHAALQPT